MSKNKLGRGFDSLIPQDFDVSILNTSSDKIIKISVNNLDANPDQPRIEFDETELDGLAQSISEHGILQPLIVTSKGNRFYIIAGERRWRAAKKAGLKTVPCIIRSAEQLQRLELALVENVQRVDLSPLEQAISISYLKDQFNLDYKEIGKKLGKAPSTVQNISRLIQLPEKAKQALRDKKLTEGHARTLLALSEEKQQLQLLDLIIKNRWSVRQAEQYVVVQKQGERTIVGAKKKIANSSPQTKMLSKVLDTKVTLRRLAKGGKLEIGYKNDAELKRIISMISPK